MFIFTLVTSQNNAKFCAAYKWVKFFICCCWRPLPGNFYARRRFSSSTSSFPSSSFLFIFVSQLSLAPSRSYSRKFAANLDFCIFISSGFGFNVVPRKLPKFNRVNDKVFSLLSLLCLPFLFFYFFQHYIINNNARTRWRGSGAGTTRRTTTTSAASKNYAAVKF